MKTSILLRFDVEEEAQTKKLCENLKEVIKNPYYTECYVLPSKILKRAR